MAITDITEYGITDDFIGGGVWFYTQNQPGTKWFDMVDNDKGWTVDFNLAVVGVSNSQSVLDEVEEGGAGIYINDGKRKEVINFLTQEIVFVNSNERVIYDTTAINDYRLIGKGDELKLFAKLESAKEADPYTLLATSSFLSPAINEGDGLKPSITQDIDGKIHAVWYDDGQVTGQIYYSFYEDKNWSIPELIVSDARGSQLPNILVDNENMVYVVYESKNSNTSSVGMIYKNELGWSNPYYLGDTLGAKVPRLCFDSQYNLIVSWEDYRYGHSEIYIRKFIKKLQIWEDEIRITNTNYGATCPSITSYFDNIYISWTKHFIEDEIEKKSIEINRYNSLTSTKIKSISVSSSSNDCDYSDILINIAGKIIIVWHDDKDGRYNIYGSVFSIDLDVLTSPVSLTTLSESHGGSRYPKLSEQVSTGDVYIVWQDFKNVSYSEFIPEDSPYGIELIDEDPYFYQLEKPVETLIRVSYYDNISNTFDMVVNNGSNTILSFADDRVASYPAVPIFFEEELPILYESYNVDRDGFININNIFKYIGCAFYTPSEDTIFHVENNLLTDDTYVLQDRDYILSGKDSRKEIRFGDFSQTLNIHYIFKSLKYYLNDAVEPFHLREIVASDYESITSLNANNALVNNYGDVWFVGTCGMMYYIEKSGRLAIVGNDEDIDTGSIEITKDIKSIVFDKYNVMFFSNPNGIFYSNEHISDYNEFKVGETSINEATVLAFDKNNKLICGGNDKTIRIYDIITDDNNNHTGLEYASVSLTVDTTTSITITSIKVDDNNIIWVGTTNGLYRIYNYNKVLKYSTANGLSSNHINDITIRNTAIRYLATSNGIVKMIGSGVDRIIRSNNSNLWNDNVKSILWQEPNILWAGTLSKINQIMVDDIDRTYESLIYEPGSNFIITDDDLQIYYIIKEEGQDVSGIVDVYINGNYTPYGYKIGKDVENRQAIWFESPLKNNDIVEIIVRKDLKLKTSFKQSFEERRDLGEKLIRIKDIIVKNKNVVVTGPDLGFNENIYVIAEGTNNEVKVNDSTSNLPFDKVHLDTIPPIGTVEVVEGGQVEKTKIQLNITADDEHDGIVGSGVEKMIVSNYDNFTTDGLTAQEPVLFNSSYIHDLGLNLNNVVSTSIEEGSGSKVYFIEEDTLLFYATSLPGAVLQNNLITGEWNEIFSYGDTNFVDFIVKYNNQLIISVGSFTTVAKIHIYDYIEDNGNISFSFSKSLSFSEPRAFCYQLVNNLLYIGSGIGNTTGIGSDGGKIYSYDGDSLEEIVKNVGDSVYSLTNITGSPDLIASTGKSGGIYEVSISSLTAIPVYGGTGTLPAIQFINYNEEGLIFVGGTDGTIRRSNIDSNSYNISFKTLSSNISILKTFNITESGETKEVLYAAIGNIIYYFSDTATWVWKYTHTEDISDIAIDSSTNNMYVVSSNYITTISPLLQKKDIYLKLIDRAGNETSLYYADEDANPITYTLKDKDWYDEDPQERSLLATSISISNLIDFVNENKIFELDENGNNIFNINGKNSFFSADRIEEEKGIYTSEIFDGTNQLVKWDTMSWQATEMYNTEVLVYIRSSSSKNDILLQDWIGPYSNTDAGGIDIGYLSGQFIQFKIELISREKDISPSFYRATIRCITSEAIHFFTTNFVLNSRIQRGILTSQKMVPISADVIFGINTTNSIDWNDYQVVDENRLFDVNQIGENIRVGIKLISPNRNMSEPTNFDEYGPYNTNLFVNTVDFSFVNNSGDLRKYHFKVEIYEDILLENILYTAYSYEKQDGFSIGGSVIDAEGFSIDDGEEVDVLFTVPGAAHIKCNTYYFIKIQSVYNFDTSEIIELISDSNALISSCSSSFIDVIDFDFTNNESLTGDYHFRIRFYEDQERVIEHTVVYSGNNVSGWIAGGVQMVEDGVTVSPGQTINVIYRPNIEDFDLGINYYLSIDALDGSDSVFSSNSYTFQVRDTSSFIYCGEYIDVPVVKNFGIMLELEDNEFVTLNL